MRFFKVDVMRRTSPEKRIRAWQDEKVRIGKVTCNLLKSVEKTEFITYSLPIPSTSMML
jgi:hypothetical protein